MNANRLYHNTIIIHLAETSSLTEQIRHGKLRPMLDLGVTPSQVSMHVGGKEEEEEEEKEASVSCIPLQSLGLGGNKITCLGAGYLAQALQTNTSKNDSVSPINLKEVIVSMIECSYYIFFITLKAC